MKGGIRGEEEGSEKYVLCPISSRMYLCTASECLFGWLSEG